MDNFNAVRQYLNFSDPDYFYLVSMIGRKKDGWDTDVTIMSFKIDSLAKFDLYKDRIIAISKSTNTRAYISASPKSKKGVAKIMLKKVVDLYTSDQFGSMNHVYDSAADSNEVEKRFVIDIDNLSTDNWHVTVDIMNFLQGRNLNYWINFSVTGVHVISEPFNIQEFAALFPDIDVKKRAKTLLFYEPVE